MAKMLHFAWFGTTDGRGCNLYAQTAECRGAADMDQLNTPTGKRRLTGLTGAGIRQADLILAPTPPSDFLGMPISGFGTANFEDAHIALPLKVGQIALNGVWQCDPRLASPGAGALLVERMATIGARLATKIATWRA